MPRKKLEELTMQAVAYMLSQNYSREDICQVLKISQPSVSRCIQYATEKGWLETTTQFVTDDIPAERVEEIKALVSPRKQLEEWLKRFAEKNKLATVPDARVLPSANRSTDATRWDERMKQFGSIAAGYIRDFIRPAEICGISWGYTITSIVRGLRKLDSLPLQQGKSIKFVPLCGEPLGKPKGKAVTQLSASSLAEQFDEIFNGGTENSLTMSPVPAVIFDQHFEKDLEIARTNVNTIRDFFKAFATGYREIFFGEEQDGQQEEPLINKLDTILTGVGAPTHPRGYWGDVLINTKGINWEILSKYIIGDIGGVLFPDPVLSKNMPNEYQMICDGWTGIKEDRMKNCAEKASHNKTPGVIVVAIGANKAKSLHESMKHRLVNKLVIDLDLAEALLQIQEPRI